MTHEPKRIVWMLAAVVLCLGAVAVFVVPKAVFAAAGDPVVSLVATGGAEPVVAELSWSAPADSAPIAYRVYGASAVDGAYHLLATCTTTHYSFCNGIGGMAYFFRVSAIGAGGRESACAQAGPVTAQWTVSPHQESTDKTNLCAQCHVQHSSFSGLLGRDELASGRADPTALCRDCHDGRVSGAANITSGSVDSFALASGHSIVDSATPGSLVQNCASCHKSHGFASASPMIPASSINSVTVAGDGPGWCESCHDAANSWFGAGYPSAKTPERDSAGYPVSGTWLGPDAYASTGNPHNRIPESTQTIDAGTPVKRAQGDCLYCHAAHRGANAYDGLSLAFRPSTPSTLASDQASGAYAASCLACHGGVVASGMATPPVDVKQFVTAVGASAGHRIVTAGGTLPAGSPLPCYDCHNAHGSTRNNRAMLSDELGGSLETSTDAGVRHFCFTCHTTADTAGGWDSDAGAYAAVGATQVVEGIARTAGELRLSVRAGHSVGDATSCDACHGKDYGAGGRNVHNPDDTYSAAQHMLTPAETTLTVGATTYGPFPCADCHAVDLGAEHAKASAAASAAGCAECHPAPRNTLAPASLTTCSQGSCHTSESSPVHGAIDSAHATLPSNAACLGSGCHTGDLAAMHAEATATVDAVLVAGCRVCHAGGVPASANCSGCHAADPHASSPSSPLWVRGAPAASVLGTATPAAPASASGARDATATSSAGGSRP